METRVANLDGRTIAETAIQDFKTVLRGPLLRPGTPRYEDARRIWNANIEKHPALIAKCTGNADIVQSVNFARENNLLVSVKGGGHSIPGTIAAPTVLNSPQFAYFNTTYTKQFGTAPLPYSNYFYDNAWIAMLSILAAGANDGTKIIQVLPAVVNHFFGSSSTGIWLVHHDQSIALYDVLKCESVSGANTFVKIGSYNGGTNKLTLT